MTEPGGAGAAGRPRIVLATRNRGKLNELRQILRGLDADVELVDLDEFPGAPDVPETGETFEQNALLKARSLAAFTGLPAIADDSGIAVEALNGMPGIFSARWAGSHGDDQANLDLLIGQIHDVPDARRGAAFVCAAALALPDGRERAVRGELAGHLLRDRRGEGGFGYDPIFVPDGDTRTTAELTAEEKNAISHRGQAFRQLAALLPELLPECVGS